MPDLTTVTAEAAEAARSSENGRHAELVVHDGSLRQTVIALRAGTTLAEHNSPPAASIQVLSGSVRITGSDPAQLTAGDIRALTHERHGVEPLEDAVFLLTTVTSVPGQASHA